MHDTGRAFIVSNTRDLQVLASFPPFSFPFSLATPVKGPSHKKFQHTVPGIYDKEASELALQRGDGRRVLAETDLQVP